MRADPKAISRFIGTNWPRAVAALKEVDAVLKEHPDVPTWVRGRFDDIRKRIETIPQRRGDAAKIRAVLEIVRTEAREFEVQGGHRIDAASWARRADNLERRVRLAEVVKQPEQKAALTRLRVEADALVGDLIDATASVPALPMHQPQEGELPEAEPPEGEPSEGEPPPAS
jgi:hypothetical protein